MTYENPYSPPHAEGDQPILEMSPRSVWVRVFLGLQLLAVALGFAAAVFIATETIVASGLALGLVGLVLLVVAWRYNEMVFFACGFSGPAFSVFVFLLIFFNDWSPNQARRPVLGLVSIYLLGLASAGVWLWLRRSGNSMNNAQ